MADHPLHAIIIDPGKGGKEGHVSSIKQTEWDEKKE